MNKNIELPPHLHWHIMESYTQQTTIILPNEHTSIKTYMVFLHTFRCFFRVPVCAWYVIRCHSNPIRSLVEFSLLSFFAGSNFFKHVYLQSAFMHICIFLSPAIDYPFCYSIMITVFQSFKSSKVFYLPYLGTGGEKN